MSIQTNQAQIKRPILEAAIATSWSKISPFWPLRNLIAVNPISGFEQMPFEDALHQASAYFRQKDLPEPMYDVNRESIKWLQAFFDEGQSTISMPQRHLGLMRSTFSLMMLDDRLLQKNRTMLAWLQALPTEPEKVIIRALKYLTIPEQDHEEFLTLMLTTLPGWAAYVQYRTNWADAADASKSNTVTQREYLALRLILTCILWPEANTLLDWYRYALSKTDVHEMLASIVASEATYQAHLLSKLGMSNVPKERNQVDAQLVFCIDIRSEPFRRALEAQGHYNTYGFAGFFGVPVVIEDSITGLSQASCPVLLKPVHHIVESPRGGAQSMHGYRRLQGIKRLYQSLKYTFMTPFGLAEVMGVASGLWMGLRSLLPGEAFTLKSKMQRIFGMEFILEPDLSSISVADQIIYAAAALKLMGMTDYFAPLIIFCGHGSTSQNNAFASALNCGACGGRDGASNARILTIILNHPAVREGLKAHAIEIPEDTHFFAAMHNTTTDNVEIYNQGYEYLPEVEERLNHLKADLARARAENLRWRSIALGINIPMSKKTEEKTILRAHDWAEVRPEWGLAGNAAMIIGPRWLSKEADLEGRAFLHSYEWQRDEDGAHLMIILTAPMVVAQWINHQYLFSTLDNVAFGGGSKVTKNITGKMGIMQGNASDLMHGLPLQSVYENDDQPYHTPIRLTVITYAPKDRIDKIIQTQNILKTLFGNGWVFLICYDPESGQRLCLQRDLSWTQLT